MINMYVDDLRKCPEGFELAKNIDEAIPYIKSGVVNILSLDHDLGESKGKVLPTGYDLVKQFCEYGWEVKEIYLHTANPVGRENMYETLLASQRRGFISKEIKVYPYPCPYEFK